jgi:ribosomal protein L11 methyltransferase
MRTLEDQVLQFIIGTRQKVNFTALKRHFSKFHPTTTKKLKQVVFDLMQAGKLCYTSHYGSSFIEISYNRPLRVSEHVILKPSACWFNAHPDQIVVSLKRGVSFGGGDHPTTRLAIKLIDALLHHPHFHGRGQAFNAIDIGSGSGILAMVAAKMGLGAVRGIDTDPCAVFEACENVRLNYLAAQVTISDESLDSIVGTFDFVFANLRTPTLCSIGSILEEKVNFDSILIFSGCKTGETMQVDEYYQKWGYSIVQMCSEKGWGALCLARGGFLKELAAPMLLYSFV